MLTFVLKLSRRSDGLVRASFPDVPVAVAYGRDDMEAYRNAAEALRKALYRYLQAGFDLPIARARGNLLVRVEEPRMTALA